MDEGCGVGLENANMAVGENMSARGRNSGENTWEISWGQ